MTAPSNDFASWVRNYVHYDNLTSQFTKQAAGARKLRDDFEDRIIQNLRTNNMQNAVIQIAGGRLQYSEEKNAPSMSLPRLEQYLHAYFKQKGNGLDETDNILRYLKVQKANDTITVAKLKKTSVLPPLPPPPGPNSLK